MQNIVIDKYGRMALDFWLDSADLENFKEALTKMGYFVLVENADYEFPENPLLKKRNRFESIPLTPKNVSIILLNQDKNNDEILDLLGISRESNFVITTLSHKLNRDYQIWLKIDDKKKWNANAESIKAFAETFRNKEFMYRLDKHINNGKTIKEAVEEMNKE